MSRSGEGEDGEVDAEHVSDDDDMRGAAQTCTEVFQPITYRASSEELKNLLFFEFQGRKNQYTKQFLKESWMKRDVLASELASSPACDRAPLLPMCQEVGNLSSELGLCNIVFSSLFFFFSLFFFLSRNLSASVSQSFCPKCMFFV